MEAHLAASELPGSAAESVGTAVAEMRESVQGQTWTTDGTIWVLEAAVLVMQYYPAVGLEARAERTYMSVSEEYLFDRPGSTWAAAAVEGLRDHCS